MTNKEIIKCKICNFECKSKGGLSNHIRQKHNITAKEYYDEYLKQENEGICPVCGKPTNFRSFSFGYSIYCSPKCVSSDPKIIKQKQKTTKQNCGVISPFLIPEVKELAIKNSHTEEAKNKSKKTKKERYGDENYNNREQYKQTCLDRFGVENVFQLEENIKKSHSPEAREKYKQTCLDKYDVENPLLIPEVIEKTHSEESIKKLENTNLKKYYKKYQLQRPEIRELALTSESREKAKQTTFDRFGVDNIFKLEEVKEKVKSHESRKKAVLTAAKNNNRSSYEVLFEKFLKDNNINFKSEYNKDPRYPFQCDFYLPDFDLFIEIHGYWMHNDHFFNKHNKKDLETLKIWKEKAKNDNQYISAINIWSKKDVQKLQTAIKNKINYIVLWNLEDINNFCLEFIK